MREGSCKLDNCVLSNGVQVRDRAILKDCELGRNVIVDAECTSPLPRLSNLTNEFESTAQLKNEQLVVELE